jgi:hypothetical protein
MSLNVKKQTGASIVTAIFLIVALALMGAGMVSLLATSHQSINHEFASAKTYMAGRTCLQWGLYQTVYFESGSITTDPNGVIFAYNFNVATSTYLNNSKCDATISRISTIPVSGGGNDLKFYNVSVIAENGGKTQPEYSKRTMQIDAEFQQP